MEELTHRINQGICSHLKLTSTAHDEDKLIVTDLSPTTSLTIVGYNDNSSTSPIMKSKTFMTDIGGSQRVRSVAAPRKRFKDSDLITLDSLTTAARILRKKSAFLTKPKDPEKNPGTTMATPLSNPVPHTNLWNSLPRLRHHNGKDKGRGTTHSTLFSFPDLNDPITLRPGQHVIVEGQHFILRGQPQITITQTTQYPLRTQTETTSPTTDQICHLCAPDNESSSENSVDAFHHCYIPPEPNEKKTGNQFRGKMKPMNASDYENSKENNTNKTCKE